MSKYALKRINTCKIGVTRQLVPDFDNTITENYFWYHRAVMKLLLLTGVISFIVSQLNIRMLVSRKVRHKTVRESVKTESTTFTFHDLNRSCCGQNYWQGRNYTVPCRRCNAGGPRIHLPERAPLNFFSSAIYRGLQPWARAVCTFPAVPRSSQPSTLRGTVNEYQLSGWVIIINGDDGCRR